MTKAASYLDPLAEFVASLPAGELPREAAERTKLIIADCVGAIVGGACEPEMEAFTRTLGGDSAGPATIIGTDRAAPPDRAALVNGTAGTWLEMDEGNQFCKGHPGMHTFPAAFAKAEELGADGPGLIAAVALGYEVGARVGTAASLRGSMHPHGTWGAICAATAVARLAGATAPAMRTTFNIASNLGLGTSRRTMLEGATVRNAFAGISGQMGIVCAHMVDAGFSGERDGIAHVFGKVLSDSFDVEAMTDELGSRWEVLRNYFKMHSCCRYNHAALDALHQIMAGSGDGPRPDDIAAIHVDTYALAVELDDPSPQNTLAAKFSLPFAIATTLFHRDSGVASFRWEAVRNPAVGELARKVALREDKGMSARLPHQRPARVRIVLHDGKVLEAETATNRGDWADPYAPEEIREKFMSLTSQLWSEEGSVAVYDAIMNLEGIADIGDLTRLMKRATRTNQSRSRI